MGAQLGCVDDRKDESQLSPRGGRPEVRPAVGRGASGATASAALSLPLVRPTASSLDRPLLQYAPSMDRPGSRLPSNNLPGLRLPSKNLPPPVESQRQSISLSSDGGAPVPELDDEQEAAREDDLVELGATVGKGEAFFWQNLSLACRTAVCCLLCSLPIIVPRWYARLDPNYSAMITSGVVEMVVFTTYKSLGATIQLAWQGFVGTLAACCVAHSMNAWMPGGAGGDHYSPMAAHVVNVLTIFVGLWLNMSKNVRMFLLCWHAYFMMEFMNPNSKAIFNTSWALNLEAYTVTTLVTTTIGVLAAIMVMVLPCPVTSYGACREAALQSAMQMTKLVSDLTDYYGRSEPSLKITQLEERASDLREMIKAMEADVETAWWETFDLGRAGKSRELLARHLRMMGKAADTIYAMQVCISREEFEPLHVEFMALIGPAAWELVDTVEDLLRSATSAASDGNLSTDEIDRLMVLAQRARAANALLAQSFDAARQRLSAGRPITEALMPEAFFAHCLSTYASMAVRYADHLLVDPPRPVPCPVAVVRAFLGIFDLSVLRRAVDVHSFTIRNTISLVLCYYVGYHLLGYSGVAAGTAALLLTDFSGSALHKNMMRLEAVCIGSVLPHLISRMLGESCHPARIVMQGVCILLWEVLTNYVYYSSPYWGYVGCLTGAFASTVLVYPCVVHETQADEAAAAFAFQSASFEKMTETAIAALVMTAVDTLLMSKRASSMATDKLLETLLMLDAGFQSTFLERDPTGKAHGKLIVRRASTKLGVGSSLKDLMKATMRRAPGQILEQLSMASAFGAEADKEPRYQRQPWPMDFFSSVVRTGHILRANLNCLERVLRGGDGCYQDVFADVRRLKHFGSLQIDLLKTSRDSINCVQRVLRNEIGVEDEKLMKKMTSMEKVDALEDLPVLIDEINASGLSFPSKVAETLEDDPLCRLSVALLLLDSTVFQVAQMVKACIKQAA